MAEWEEIGQLKIWKPAKENEVLEGKVASVKEQSSFGKSWTIVDAEGEEVQTPAHKVLQNRMENCKVGDHVRITFLGTEAAKVRGQSPMAIYKVERRKA
jgi:hypothetical protein